MEIKFNWFQILDHMQFGLIESLKKNSPTHDGDLRKSLSSDVTDTQLTVYAIYYALYVEEGTMPHFPPIDALKKWCKDKLGDENAAYAVQKKIGLYGTKPTWFIRDTLEQELLRLLVEALKQPGAIEIITQES
jgi:hypothetical protein